jgi:hypothetical protein
MAKPNLDAAVEGRLPRLGSQMDEWLSAEHSILREIKYNQPKVEAARMFTDPFEGLLSRAMVTSALVRIEDPAHVDWSALKVYSPPLCRNLAKLLDRRCGSDASWEQQRPWVVRYMRR